MFSTRIDPATSDVVLSLQGTVFSIGCSPGCCGLNLSQGTKFFFRNDTHGDFPGRGQLLEEHLIKLWNNIKSQEVRYHLDYIMT